MLRVSLIGHLGADAELRSTQKGSRLVGLRVAVSQVRTGSGGQREETTEWFRVRVMGRQIESAQRLAKGARVFVAGRLDISHYQSREREPRTTFDVWADEVQNLSSRASAEPASTSDPNPHRPEQRPASAGRPVGYSPPSVDDSDELPF
jgi:single-strand DNA-binding protein